MQTIHLELGGKSTRVSLQTLPAQKTKVAPITKTSAGPVHTLRVTNGRNPKIDPFQLSQAQLIESDPELLGSGAGEVLSAEMISAAYYDPTEPDPVPVPDFKLVDHVFDPQGQEKETRPYVLRRPNLNELHPVKIGKRVPLVQALTQFVFKESRQIIHVDGLSYDFLFALAKDLHEKQEIAILGAGAKGNQPLIMREKGSPNRAFLYGEIGTGAEADRYRLLLLLSNQELKIPADRLAAVATTATPAPETPAAAA